MECQYRVKMPVLQRIFYRLTQDMSADLSVPLCQNKITKIFWCYKWVPHICKYCKPRRDDHNKRLQKGSRVQDEDRPKLPREGTRDHTKTPVKEKDHEILPELRSTDENRDVASYRKADYLSVSEMSRKGTQGSEPTLSEEPEDLIDYAFLLPDS